MKKESLPFALPDLDENEIDAVTEVLRSGWITMGSKTFQFEEEFARFVKAKHALAVNSCTAAIHLALEAAGVESGDFVITTCYTFAATAEVIRYLDAIPLFVDIDPATFNLDTNLLEELLVQAERSLGANPKLLSLRRGLSGGSARSNRSSLTGRLKAIIPVHYAGQPCEMDKIYSLAKKYGLAVVEDAAHALPASFRGRMIGETSKEQENTATCFSFYATKPVTTGEGGMVTTENDEWAERMKLMRLHGISQDAWNRYSIDGSWRYQIVAPGFKYNMSDLSAAIGLVQLAKADKCWQRRCEIAATYHEAFSKTAGLEPPLACENLQHAWHLYPLRLNLELLSIDRSQFLVELRKRKIGGSVHYIPLHMHPYYQHQYGYDPDDFPIAKREFEREVSLPIFSKMSDDDVSRVIDATLEIVGSSYKTRFNADSGH